MMMLFVLTQLHLLAPIDNMLASFFDSLFSPNSMF